MMPLHGSLLLVREENKVGYSMFSLLEVTTAPALDVSRHVTYYGLQQY
jgi:hypothetical protein